MKTLTLFFTLVFFASAIATKSLAAETLKIRSPSINGKLIANGIEMTDWQTVLSCSYNVQGIKKTAVRYPQTALKKLEASVYSLKIKAALLRDIPHLDFLTCSYKLILIGKNISTRQLAFGEILLMGRDSGIMSESEIQNMLDINQMTKILNDKTKELVLTFGKDGGIVEEL
ncbi:MAG: hypothetical protein ACXVLQ_10380 [Bacteriovorax sp.]